MRSYEARRAERIASAVERWVVGGFVGLVVYVGCCALGIALTTVIDISLPALTLAAWTVLALSCVSAALVAKGLTPIRPNRTRSMQRRPRSAATTRAQGSHGTGSREAAGSRRRKRALPLRS